MLVFGLTGGIGSGKSTVAARFRERGLPVVDADQVARDAVAPGSDGLAELVAAFGPGVLDPDGALDRKRLAAVVFADAAERKRLEAIVHPRVRALTIARFAALAGAGEPLACNEVPLLVESGLAAALRPLVVVSVPEAVQLERTVARDGCTADEARARVRAQLPLADKVALADHVIDNSGDRAATCRRADEVLDTICTHAGVDPARYPR
ncbi:MAG: dephospho-CoA kinase [Polyangiaceae bacterium]|nr:dephospho-CoA kinase [Polyangiaceae bacterium]